MVTSASKLESEVVEPVTPVLIALGGFKSCEGDSSKTIKLSFDRSIENYRRQVKQVTGQTPLVMRGCFKNKLNEGSSYFFDGFDNRVWDLRVSSFFGNQHDARSEYRLIATSIASAARQRTKEIKNPVFFIAGHSIGGWLGHTVAQQLVARNQEVGGFMSLDPISGISCSPRDYLLQLAQVQGCLEAPREWASSASGQLYQDIDSQWFNFYQTQFKFLHSGPVAILERDSKNIELKYPQGSVIQHTLLDDDQRVWTFFASQTIRHVGDRLSVQRISNLVR